MFLLMFMVLGMALRRSPHLPKGSAGYLNGYLINIVLPALALLYLPSIALSAELLLPVAAAWISFGLAWLLFGLIGKWRSWSRSHIGCLIITCGLANTSFVGFPVVQALYGADGLQIALLIDQAGSFILVGSLALVVASIYGHGQKRKRDISLKILTFPPFLFFIIAIGMNFLGLELPLPAKEGLGIIALTLSPVALTAVGLQIEIQWGHLRNRFLWIGLAYKLLVIPLVVLLLFAYVFGAEGLVLKVSVIEMAMAPMITGSIIAIAHGLEPKLASLLVGLGIPLSLFTLAGWYAFLHFLM